MLAWAHPPLRHPAVPNAQAGSERLDSSGVVGDRLKETQSINKSLSTLGQVLTSLGEPGTLVAPLPLPMPLPYRVPQSCMRLVRRALSDSVVSGTGLAVAFLANH